MRTRTRPNNFIQEMSERFCLRFPTVALDQAAVGLGVRVSLRSVQKFRKRPRNSLPIG